MKKLTLLFFGIVFTTFIYAQEIFVRFNKWGQDNILGNLGYNYYHYQHFMNQCDTLICSNPGYELCKISKNIMKVDPKNNQNFKIFNKAIRKTIRYIKKHQLASGEFTETILEKKVLIQFKNGNEQGEGDFLIKILE